MSRRSHKGLRHLPPSPAQTKRDLGLAALREKRLPDAAAAYRQALELEPGHAPTLHNLGLCLNLLDQPREAAQVLQEALIASPQAAETWLEYLRAVEASEGKAALLPLLYEALSYCFEHPGLLYRLGKTLLQLNRLTEALPHLWHALRIADVQPGTLELAYDLAYTLYRLKRLSQAEELFRRILKVDANYQNARLNLAVLLHETRRFAQAEREHRQVIARAPHDALAHQNLAMTLMAQGRIEAGIAEFREALRLQPIYPVARSNLLLALLYSDRVSPVDIIEETRKVAADYPHTACAPARRPLAGRRLRIGYVSGDFRRHVIGMLMQPVFRAHDAGRVEVFAYSNSEEVDPVTVELRRHSSQWRVIAQLPDAAVAALIRHDAIDVLIDLSGHTADHRLGVFALHPAPVQASWLGFPGSVGLPAIGWRLTDAVLDPPGEEAMSLETPVRLPHGWFCYAPGEAWCHDAPVTPLPASSRGHITFGAFNNLAKVSPSCLDLWAQVLAAVPDSRLICRAKPFADRAAAESFRQAFAQRGVDAGRIQPLPYVPDPVAHLSIYGEVDIHLDSLPYGGGVTTADALWMGVPVVTLLGDRPAGRLAASFLHSLGRSEWVAASAEEYVAIAMRLAGDWDALAEIRAGLRPAMRTHPRNDPIAFTRALEDCLFRLAA